MSQSISKPTSLSSAQTALLWSQSNKLSTTQIKVPLKLPDETGCLSDAVLELWETPDGSALAARWVASPDLLVDHLFEKSLENARAAVNGLDATHALWPTGSRLAVRWWFPRPPAEGVKDGSAGCIFALGLIALFRSARLIPAQHRHRSHMHTVKDFPFHLLTASAQITAAGELVAVEGLDAKETAPGMKHIRHLILSRDQSKNAAASASTRQIHPCSNLNQVLLKVAAVMSEEPGIKAVEPQRWVKWARWAVAIVVVAILLLWLYFWDQGRKRAYTEKHPTAAQLQARFPSDVNVYTEGCPTDCSFVVNFAKTTDYSWVTRVWGPLQKVRSPFAMVLGGDYRRPHDDDQVHLGSFGELLGLRSLYMSQCEITDLQGAENLNNLERFVNSGGRLRDLRWLDELYLLKVLVLDSPHTKIYPGFRSQSLEKLIAHLPEDRDDLWLGRCPNLRCLALRADGLTDLNGLDELPLLEEVILHIESMQEVDFRKGNHIHSLELAHCKDAVPLEKVGETFPALRRLTLKDTRFTELTGFDKADHLESLVVEDCQGLERLDLTGLKSLQRLVVRRTPLKQITGLASCPQLRELNLYKVKMPSISFSSENQSLSELMILESPLAVLEGVGELFSLKGLYLEKTKIAKLEPLTKLKQLELIEMHESLLDELPTVSAGQNIFLNAASTPLHHRQKGTGYFQASDDEQSGWRFIDADAFPNDYSLESSPIYILLPEFYSRREVGKEDKFMESVFDDGEYLSKYSYQDGSEVWFDSTGWGYKSRVNAGKRGFDVDDLMKQWGISDQLGLVSYVSDYSGEYQDPESLKVRPFAKKQDRPPAPSAEPSSPASSVPSDARRQP